MSNDIRHAVAELRQFLATADPANTSLDDAAAVVIICAEIERMGAAIQTLYTVRAGQAL